MPTSEPTRPISFRILDPKRRKKFDLLAAAHGMSPGDFARHLVEEYLDDAERERLRDDLKRLDKDITALSQQLKKATLVVTQDEEVSQEELHSWVKEQIFRE